MKIYTRTGDGGDTGLYGGRRVPKSHRRVAAYGDLDELNAALGVASAHLAEGSGLRARIAEIQSVLFGVSGEIATESEKKRGDLRGVVVSADVERLESSIDEMEGDLPALQNFILPGGSLPASSLHLARTVCRRAERAVVFLSLEDAVRPEILRFLNRLSDWLFVAARYMNKQHGVPDTPW